MGIYMLAVPADSAESEDADFEAVEGVSDYVEEPDKVTSASRDGSESVAGDSASSDASLTIAGSVSSADIKCEESVSADSLPQNTVSDNEAPVAAVTQFVTYEPADINSKYYSDPGRKALTTEAQYIEVDEKYFEDALFIGDSRTVGVNDYSGWNSTFLADNGYCTYSYIKHKPVKNHKTGKKELPEDVLSSGTYSKIYLMLGMNDCGYGNTDNFRQRYQAMISMIREKQPDAVIYLVSVLHLSKDKNDPAGVMNNIDINDKNVAIAECADGINTFYLDFNDYFTDDEGYLKQETTFDGVHFYADYYQQYCELFKKYAVKR
jgi:hypothetical protein